MVLKKRSWRASGNGFLCVGAGFQRGSGAQAPAVRTTHPMWTARLDALSVLDVTGASDLHGGRQGFYLDECSLWGREPMMIKDGRLTTN